jgi:CRISPR-associated endonuclease/helicase Cas3
MLFADWFTLLSGSSHVPHAWQNALAGSDSPRSRLIRVPTGMGKTLGVLAAWSWHRLSNDDTRWPTRLVWCLPMRVLVEQTEAVATSALRNAGLLWDQSSSHSGKVGVHVLMGGAEARGDWSLYPEHCAVVIGTQDMLLSRALNRGYAAGRAAWPREFGLLSSDALWVLDEVQLMDVGMATSAQIQAFQDDDAPKALRPRHTWWMSATLQAAWLESVDTQEHHPAWSQEQTSVSLASMSEGLGAIAKSLACDSIEAKACQDFACRVLREHAGVSCGEHGKITLVVCNTVDRASLTYDECRNLAPDQEIRLVHGRFRPHERLSWREEFLSREACHSGVDRIIVATQVVEAGVDISAGCLVTELAPWSSLVQRFGRCARYGGVGAIIVIDRGLDEASARPYSGDELIAAREALAELEGNGGGVGISSLQRFESGLDAKAAARLYPYQARHLIIRREFDELFDTTPDLTGADIDVSRFVRATDDRDLQVFWLDVARASKGQPALLPSPERQPRREELCAVPFLAARDWLCGEESNANRKPRLRGGIRAWVWDWLEGEWLVAERAMLVPGRIVCVAADSGGYLEDRGFTPDSTREVTEVPRGAIDAFTGAANEADGREGSDAFSRSEWKTIGLHSDEVVAEVAAITGALRLPENVRTILSLAARWHDVGKAHPAFQGAIRPKCGRAVTQDVAKAPQAAWLRPLGSYRTADDSDSRPRLRHELASALALFAVLRQFAPEHAALLGPWTEVLKLTGQYAEPKLAQSGPGPFEKEILALSADAFDLLVYLVAAHHGKVRASLLAAPTDQDYEGRDGRGLPIRGVRDGDILPGVALSALTTPLSPLTLSLQPAMLGLSPISGRSWRERSADLVKRFGPAGLAFLEALMVAADRRASMLQTEDTSPQLRDVAR